MVQVLVLPTVRSCAVAAACFLAGVLFYPFLYGGADVDRGFAGSRGGRSHSSDSRPWPSFTCPVNNAGTTGTQEHRSHRCGEGTLWRWLTQVDIEEILLGVDERLGIRDGDSVFEAGSGCGSGLAFLQRRHSGPGRRGIHVSGIDISRGALAFARKTYRDNAQFCFGDVTRPYPFIPDASFDVSFSYGVIGYLTPSDSCLALRELVRVTKPGGGIFFNTQEPDCPSYTWGRAKQRRLWRRCLRGLDVKLEVVPEFELRRGQSVHRNTAYCPHQTTGIFVRKALPLPSSSSRVGGGAMVRLPVTVDTSLFRNLAQLALDRALLGRAQHGVSGVGSDRQLHVPVFDGTGRALVGSGLFRRGAASDRDGGLHVTRVTEAFEDHPERIAYELHFDTNRGSAIALLEHTAAPARCQPSSLNGLSNHSIVVAGGFGKEDRIFQRGISIVDRRDHLSVLLFASLPPLAPPGTGAQTATRPAPGRELNEFTMFETEWSRENDEVRRYPNPVAVKPLEHVEFILRTPDGRAAAVSPFIESAIIDELGAWVVLTNWPEYQTQSADRLRWPLAQPGEYTLDVVDARGAAAAGAAAAAAGAAARKPLCSARFTVVDNVMQAVDSSAMQDAVAKYWVPRYVVLKDMR